jgi:cytochrome c biogenesis protein ResB
MNRSTVDNEQAEPSGVGYRVVRILGSLPVALAVVLLLALACIVGTLFPQACVYDSWWFVGLLFVLSASLMVCTVRRYRAIRRVTGAARLRVMGSFVTHVSLLLILTGGVVRVIWGQKGVIQFREGQVVGRAESQEGSMVLPFSLRLTTFELEYHESPESSVGTQVDQLVVRWAERNVLEKFPVELNVEHVVKAVGPVDSLFFKVKVLRYVPDFVLDRAAREVKSRSKDPHNPAVQIEVVGNNGTTNKQWVFARYPDYRGHGGAGVAMPLTFIFLASPPVERGRSGAIKAFKSKVDVLEDGRVASTCTIAVNSPLMWKGYTFYQSSYHPGDLTWSELQVVRDPGVPIVYAGFILMMVGLTLVFCVGPWLGSQQKVTGVSG